ncbi:hypothetical protein JTB14_002656 [Gonioctena quinquepunctata]|nr:hypothetical protein JTB14_002656 [Gonioctena quinquepunctata]
MPSDSLKINDMIDIAERSKLHKRKAQLMEGAQEYSEMLNKRPIETETLIHFGRSIRNIENNFDHYEKSTEDLEKLADHIEIIHENFERTDLNRKLGKRKQSCIE